MLIKARRVRIFSRKGLLIGKHFRLTLQKKNTIWIFDRRFHARGWRKSMRLYILQGPCSSMLWEWKWYVKCDRTIQMWLLQKGNTLHLQMDAMPFKFAFILPILRWFAWAISINFSNKKKQPTEAVTWLLENDMCILSRVTKWRKARSLSPRREWWESLYLLHIIINSPIIFRSGEHRTISVGKVKEKKQDAPVSLFIHSFIVHSVRII